MILEKDLQIAYSQDWESLGMDLGDLWESFGKIYLNLDGKI